MRKALISLIQAMLALWVAASHTTTTQTSHPGHGISPSLLLSLHHHHGESRA